jgi:hypothetical protein
MGTRRGEEEKSRRAEGKKRRVLEEMMAGREGDQKGRREGDGRKREEEMGETRGGEGDKSRREEEEVWDGTRWGEERERWRGGERAMERRRWEQEKEMMKREGDEEKKRKNSVLWIGIVLVLIRIHVRKSELFQIYDILVWIQIRGSMPAADPCLWLMEPDPDSDPDPTIFVIDLQDANKKLV